MADESKPHRSTPHNDLGAEYIRSTLDYDPETGKMTWKMRWDIPPPSRARLVGKVAGSLNNEGYICIKVQDALYKAHRLAWLIVTGSWPKEDIDHINGDRADNRFCNLREATRQQNCFNAKAKSRNRSGFKGVSLERKTGKWRAVIQGEGRMISLGLYFTKEEAHAAYCEAAKRLYGEFARFK